MKKIKFETIMALIFLILMIGGLIFMGIAFKQIKESDIKYQTFAMVGSIMATISAMMLVFLLGLIRYKKL